MGLAAADAEGRPDGRGGVVVLPGVEEVPVMGADVCGAVETAGGAWQPASVAATRPRIDASRKGRGKETDTAKEERVVMVLGSGGAAVGGAKHRTPGHTCRRLFCNVLLSMAAFRWAERGMKHGAG